MSNQIIKLSQLSYLASWARSIGPNLGPNIEVDLDGGLLIKSAASDEEMATAADILLSAAVKSRQIGRVIDRFLGELISHYAIVKECTWAEAIEALQLCETDGRAMRTLSKLPRIVSRLDAETLSIPDLSTKHFDVATSFQKPSDERMTDRWNEGVKGILIEASESPSERGSRWMREQMKKLQVECGMNVEGKDTATDILKYIAELGYMLQRWLGEDEFERLGTSRRLVAERYDQYVNEALNKGLIDSPDDPVHYQLPWETKKVIDENQQA